MTIHLRSLLLIIMFASSVSSLAGQENTDYFRHYGIGEGLSAGHITCIFRASNGQLWVGTQDGLNRFDGYDFEVFRHTPFDSTTLSGNHITALAEDHRGQLWVGTFGNGVNILDPKTGVVIQVDKDLSGQEHISQKVIRQIAVIDDTVWVSHLSGLSRIELDKQGQVTKSEMPSLPRQDEVQYIRIERLRVDSLKNLWAGTNFGLFRKANNSDEFKSLGTNFSQISWARDFTLKGTELEVVLARDHRLYRYNAEADTFQLLVNGPYGQGMGQLSTLCHDAKGRLWVGTRSRGFHCRASASEDWVHFAPDIRKLGSFWSEEATEIADGGQGTIWVGSLDGLFVWSPGRNKFRRYTNYNSLAPERLSSIWALHLTPKNHLWVGTGSQGLAKVDRTNGTVEWYKPGAKDKLHIPHRNISTLLGDDQGNLWIGGMEGLTQMNLTTEEQRSFEVIPNGKGLVNGFVRALAFDRWGNLWIATNQGLNRYAPSSDSWTAYRSDPQQVGSLPSDRLISLYIDGQDRLWIGGFTALAMLPLGRGEVPESDQFTAYRHTPTDPRSLSNGPIISLLEDYQQRFWIGTSDGLDLFDRETGKSVAKFGPESGLSSAVILSLLEDQKGRLWMGHSNGLSMLDPVSNRIQNFSTLDGLQPGEFNGGAAYISPSGEVFFGGMEGVNSFVPESLYRNVEPPTVGLSSFQIESGPDRRKLEIREEPQLEVQWNENFFVVSYQVNSPVLPERNKSRYRLRGLQEEWVEAPGKFEARYAGVPPGNYVLEVIGENSDGLVQAKPTALHLVIRAPFWQEWWFRAACLLLVLLTTVSIWWAINRTRKKRKSELDAAVKAENEKLRKATARDYHDEMGHYITRIMLLSGLMARNSQSTQQQDLSSKIQENCQHLARGTRDFIWSLDPNQDTLKDLALHLAEFGESLFEHSSTSFMMENSGEEFESVPIPLFFRRQISMIVKEALHNSLKHADASNVKLSFLWENPDLEVQIWDDGGGGEAREKVTEKQLGNSNKHAGASYVRDFQTPTSGSGLRNMEERTRQIGGQLYISRLDRGGWQVQLNLSLLSTQITLRP